MEDSPRTRRLIRFIFLLLGIGILAPWNAFISAKSYFSKRKCASQGDPVDDSIESTFAMVYNLSSVASLGLILLFQWIKDQLPSYRLTNSERETETTGSHAFWLVMVPLTVYFLVFFGQAVLVLLQNLPLDVFWHLTLISLSFCGICGSIATAGVVGTAGLFPSDLAMSPFLAGQSVGGVAVAVANFFAAVVEDPEPYRKAHCSADSQRFLSENETCLVYTSLDWAVFSYFVLGSLVLAACLFGYSYIDKYQHQNRQRTEYETVRSVEVSITEESPRVGLELNTSTIENLESVTDYVHEEILAEAGSPESSVATVNELIEENETTAVWKHIKGPATCIFLVFVVTLGLFPGWVSELRSAHQCKSPFRLANDLYTPMAFVVFNVGDLAGRLLSAKIPHRRIHHLSQKLVIGACLRFLFFPLLLICLTSHESIDAIHSDLYSFLIQVGFAVSNGLLVNISFVHAPELLPAVSHVQERSSEILTFSVAFGLLTGSILSYKVV